jgi:hypothetical protein
MSDKLLEVSMMLGDAIEKLNNLSAYKDPYAHLKEAQERGEVIQILFPGRADWRENPDSIPLTFCYPPDRYRIKPKEKKKLYLWAFLVPCDDDWSLNLDYHATEDEVRASWSDNKEEMAKVKFKRIDNSMIEVDA